MKPFNIWRIERGGSLRRFLGQVEAPSRRRVEQCLAGIDGVDPELMIVHPASDDPFMRPN